MRVSLWKTEKDISFYGKANENETNQWIYSTISSFASQNITRHLIIWTINQLRLLLCFVGASQNGFNNFLS